MRRDTDRRLGLLLPLAACAPHAPLQALPEVAAEFRLTAANTAPVTVECVIRVVQPPAVSVQMNLHNGTDHAIVIANDTSAIHVVHITGATNELRVFHGPTANPSSDEVHLLLRDPTKFEPLAAGATAEFRGGFRMRPSATGAYFEPGDSADDFLPMGCAATWWDEASWTPERFEAGAIALTTTLDFRGSPQSGAAP